MSALSHSSVPPVFYRQLLLTTATPFSLRPPCACYLSVKDWAAVEKVYDHAFRQVLRLNPAEHPIMSSESMSADRQQREKLAELFFEKFDSPAVFLSKSPVLAA